MNFAKFFFYFLLSFSGFSLAQDGLTPGQSVKDGETMISAEGTFELGFFGQDNSSSRRYLGIWYRKVPIRTVIWVANRGTPLLNVLGVLQFNAQGSLILLSSTNGTVWSSNTSRTTKNPVVQLLDSGNLVIKDGSNAENILWQSFDFPYNTLLPDMKLGWNLDTGMNKFLTSWNSPDDPSEGNFSCLIKLGGVPQLFIMEGDTVRTRSGIWNGLQFTGSPQLKPNPVFNFIYVSNEHEIYYSYELKNSSIVSRLILSEKGGLDRYVWIDRTQSWTLFFGVPTDQCDSYQLCGQYASCNINNYPVCACLQGFVPKSPTDWSASDWSDGCVRRTQLDCHSDGFRKHREMKLPDTSSSWTDKSIGLKECEELCRRNCSCLAYANLDIRGSGCLLWFDDLIDMREFTEGGQDLYIRMAVSELDSLMNTSTTHTFYTSGNGKKVQIGVIVSSAILIVVLVLGITVYIRKKKQRRREMERSNGNGGKEDMELPIFDLSTIVKATNNFSFINILGQGGFGPVYKGRLADGQEVAVKRLSKSSGQGLTEFKNEVILISKLQHRNLVRLLGCCIQEDETMLIYEFMPNKSLDFFIFDEMRSNFLDWKMRFHIIDGIARGLLYLHQDSRLRIIHRDLKASNVLLDKNMNPKICDFGLARIFGGDQTEANTSRVAGTYGYMSPEYVVDGLFSMKSDVYSFGVLVLEIVSGKRNRGFSHPDHNHNLLGHAWKLWLEERSTELVETKLDSYAESEVLRCVHVGLLCVQQRPEDRPNMSSVVIMLGSETSLPQPKQPGFFTERNIPEAESSSSNYGSSSVNEMSTTLLQGR